jgi:rod shape-determining protein MreC
LKKYYNNKYFWLGFFLIVISMLAMQFTSYRNDISMLEKIIRNLYTPLQSGVIEFRDGLGSVNTYFSNKVELQKEVNELKEDRNRLLMENQLLREDKMEVRRLRKLLGFIDISLDSYQLVAARVIARSPNNWYENIVIDKGSKDGIYPNMVVINPDGLVGKVTSVSRDSAHVDLITHQEIAVGATVQETRETQGIIEGLGNSELLQMVNIPYYAKLEKGNHIITSGLSEYYPKGIDIGIVKEVKAEPDGMLLTAWVEPAVSFDKLEEVLVITRDLTPGGQDNINVEENGE